MSQIYHRAEKQNSNYLQVNLPTSYTTSNSSSQIKKPSLYTSTVVEMIKQKYTKFLLCTADGRYLSPSRRKTNLHAGILEQCSELRRNHVFQSSWHTLQWNKQARNKLIPVFIFSSIVPQSRLPVKLATVTTNLGRASFVGYPVSWTRLFS